MRYVLDASALLAMFAHEPGAERVAEVFGAACISSVNLCEVATVLSRHGGTADQVRSTIELTAATVVPTDSALAIHAGVMWPQTKSSGASLGDRVALALARRLDAILLTTDRALARIAPDVGVTAEMIR